MAAASDAHVRAGRRTIRISSAARPVFPADGITKLDLVRHYAAVGPLMVPLVRGRPLALEVRPKGIGGEGFFLKQVPGHFPEWIHTADVPKREGGVIRQALGDDVATLVYLAGQNAVTPHVWTARADRLEQPDRIVFDLDPADDDFAFVRDTARRLGALLRDLGLGAFAMTTGSRGIHVVTPLRRGAGYDEVHAFALAVATEMVDRDPDRLTVEFRKAGRDGRLYLDIGRNSYGQHAVAPYAVRARDGAPVATPVRWEELDDDALTPRRWDVRTIGERIAEAGDPWEGMGAAARGVGPAARALGDAG